MTRPQFELLALALKGSMPVYTGDRGHMDYAWHCEAHSQWCKDVDAILRACAATNPRFNKMKFLDACGVPTIVEIRKARKALG